MPRRISIFGSCVSRDTLEFADPGAFKLRRYIARQSLVSAFDTHGRWNLDLEDVASDFQRRMANWDLDSEFARLLPTIAEDSDTLLMDLTDERLGFYEMPNGSVITRTVDLIGAGIDDQLQREGRHVRFGTLEHFRRWRAALGEFRQTLDRLGIRNNVRLLAVPWATHDRGGERIDYHGELSIGRANRVYWWYLREARKVVPTITVSRDVSVRGSHEHRWGLAPFHYDDSVYENLVAALALRPRQ